MSSTNISDRTPSLLWVALGGIATALAFPLHPIPYAAPLSLWPLIFVSLAPFFGRLLRCSTIWETVTTTLAFAVPWLFIAGVWVFRMFDALGWILIWLPIGALVIFAMAANFVRWCGYSVTWSWPLLWIAVEFIRSEWSPLRLNWLSAELDPLNFTWFGLGHPRLVWPPAAQSADLIGGYGLAFMPFLTNLMLASFWVFRAEVSRTFVGFVVLCGLADAGYCKWRWTQAADGNTIAVGVVQSERYDLSILKGLTETLLGAAPDTQLVVWPELAFSAKPGDQQAVHEFARLRKVTLVTGVEIPTADGYRNRAWWLPAHGEGQEYAKQTRVPFVERHSASDVCTTFVLPTPIGPVQVGVLICYDIDFARPARRLVNECGAEVIVLPTLDDVTWGGTQHFQHALLPRLRAIENRRPIVQAATSGVSQILDHRGQSLASVPFRLCTRPDRPTTYFEGFATANVFPQQFRSFYGVFGHLMGPIIASVALGLFFSVFLFRFWARK